MEAENRITDENALRVTSPRGVFGWRGFRCRQSSVRGEGDWAGEMAGRVGGARGTVGVRVSAGIRVAVSAANGWIACVNGIEGWTSGADGTQAVGKIAKMTRIVMRSESFTDSPVLFLGFFYLTNQLW